MALDQYPTKVVEYGFVKGLGGGMVRPKHYGVGVGVQSGEGRVGKHGTLEKLVVEIRAKRKVQYSIVCFSGNIPISSSLGQISVAGLEFAHGMASKGSVGVH